MSNYNASEQNSLVASPFFGRTIQAESRHHMNAQFSRRYTQPRLINSSQARVVSTWKAAPAPGSFVTSEQTLALAVTSRNATSVPETMSVEGVTALLLERGLSGVAVVDDEGRLVGVVAAADLLREGEDHGDGVAEWVSVRSLGQGGVRSRLGSGFHATCLARATAKEIMTLAPAALSAGASVADAASVMAREGLAQIPIVGSRGEVLDVVSATDVMRWMASVPAVVFALEEQECLECARMLRSLCGDNVAQQAWFRRIPHVGLCSAH